MSTVIELSEQLNAVLAQPETTESLLPIVPTPGVYSDMDFMVYARIDAASQSKLSRLVPPSTPAHCRAYMQQPPKKTEALIIGNATHCAILEPDSFTSRYVTLGQCDAVKKSDGQRCSNNATVLKGGVSFCGVHFKGSSDDVRQVLTPKDYADCLSIRDAVWAHPAARALLMQGTDRELSMVWRDDPSTEMCKGRIDVPASGIETIIDLKSTISAARDNFAWSIRKFGYHRQAAMYLDGAFLSGVGDFKNYVFIAYEKTPPFAVATYRLSDTDIVDGGRELAQLLALYSKCRREDHWPAYSEDLEDISLPVFGGSYMQEVI
jgi:exodeoxyribonuclease VIII